MKTFLAIIALFSLLGPISVGADLLSANGISLLVVINPESQPFVFGTAQNFDVQITNIGPASVRATMLFLDLYIPNAPDSDAPTICGFTTSDSTSVGNARADSGNLNSVYRPGATNKEMVPINLAPGQSMTILAVTDLGCNYQNLPPGTYTVIGALRLYNGPGKTDGTIVGNSVPITVTSAPVPPVSTSLSTPPPLPSAGTSYLEQDLSTQSISLDFFETNGQEDLMNGPSGATLAKGGRLVQALASGDHASRYIEIGDVSGVFGTPAMSDEWYGHYATWEDAAGTITTSVLGDSYPTGSHELHIGPNDTGYYLLVDYDDLLDIQGVSGPSIQMQAFLANSNALSGTFTSGTAVAYLQYQDVSANYHFWSTPVSGDTNYAGSQSAYDGTNYNVVFSPRNPPSISIANALSRHPEPFDAHQVHKPAKYRLAGNRELVTRLERQNPFFKSKIRFDASAGQIEGLRLLRYADTIAKSGFVTNSISPDRMVWSVVVKTRKALTVNGRIFPIDTAVSNIVDAQTGQLLSFSIHPR